MLPTTVTFLTCGRWLPLFENLSTLTTFGPGMRPSFSAFSFGAGGRQSTSSLPMCWIGAAPKASLSSPSRASRAARSSEKTRILTRPWASSAASISRRTAGVAPSWPIATTGIEVMRFGALLLALGGAEEEGGHAPIIGAA